MVAACLEPGTDPSLEASKPAGVGSGMSSLQAQLMLCCLMYEQSKHSHMQLQAKPFTTLSETDNQVNPLLLQSYTRR